MSGIIYLLTNTRTNMQYVGQTIQSLDARFSGHVAAANSGEMSLIANAIRVSGSSAFTKQILENNVRATDLDNYEAYYISFYNTRRPNGYNERLP